MKRLETAFRLLAAGAGAAAIVGARALSNLQRKGDDGGIGLVQGYWSELTAPAQLGW
jgi:hypothetical protein